MKSAMRKSALVLAVLLIAGASSGCRGCSCGKDAPAPVAAATDGAPVPATPSPTLAAVQNPQVVLPQPLDRIMETAKLVPSNALWVAVFDPIRIRDVLHKIAGIAPKLVRANDYKQIRTRILDLYGVDNEKLGGPCLLAGLKSGGILLVCASIDKVVVPVDASLWSVADYRGPVVFRRNSRVSLGVVDGRLVAGDENAIYEAVQHYAHGQPSLAQLLVRKASMYRDLSADDAFRDFALFFPGQFNPGWCAPENCSGTAIFGGTDRFLVVAIASSEAGVTGLQESMQAAWRNLVGIPWEAARANPRIPPDYLKDGDTALADNSLRSRADRVIFEARGDILDVLSVTRMGDIDWLLGL